MSGSGDNFGEDVAKLENVRLLTSTEYLHEYTGVLAESNERVRISTLAPELVDIDAAVDAFTQVVDTWHNASANANILTIRERDTEPRPWIAVPDEGETLATMQPDIAPEDIETVVAETSDALRTLGLYNTVHGHLSPDDIYIQSGTDEAIELIVEIGGFGLKAAVSAAVGEHEPTAYTAPEFVDSSNQPTAQTDVYGLGAVTYFALTGQPPVDGADLEAAMREGPTDPPSTYDEAVPSDLDDVVMQALSTLPEDRYDSPYAFGRAFLSAFDPTVLEADTDEPEGQSDQSAATDNADTDDQTGIEDTAQQASEDDDDENESGSVTRRAALSLLGLGAIGGTGTIVFQNQLFGLIDTGRPSEQSPVATLTPTPTSAEPLTSAETPAATEPPADGIQEAKVAADDGSDGDEFGGAVAVSGNGTTALIGAPEDGGLNGVGGAYVFSNIGGSWSQQSKLTPSDGDSENNFGTSISLSRDGNIAIIGASEEQTPAGQNAGSAYIFDSTSSSWSQQAKLTADDADRYDEFGDAVGVSSDGSTAIVGSRYDEGSGGSAYIFDNNGATWSQQAKLNSDDGDNGDIFGSSVALSGDGTTAIIGAAADDDPNGPQAGSAYVFSSGGDQWDQQEKLTPNSGDRESLFGWSVTMSNDGTTAVIGGRYDSNLIGEMGSAYIFDSVGGSWVQQARLRPNDGTDNDNFGRSVTVSGDGTTALIGAASETNANGSDAGSVYVFENADESWTQQNKLIADDGDDRDFFGAAVAISGDNTTAIIGAYRDENPHGSGRSGGGSAYVFNL